MAYSDTDQALRDEAIAAYQAVTEDALQRLQQARERLPLDGGLLICEVGALQSVNDPAALEQLVSVLDQAPDWIDGHRALARYRFENGNPDYLAQLEKALKVLPNKGPLWRLYMQLLADGGYSEKAATTARMLRKRGAPVNDFILLEARYAGMAGLHDLAEDLFSQLPAHWTGKALDEARHRLRQGDGQRAEIQLAAVRNARPDAIVAWALTEICWRLTDDPRHAWLLPDSLLPVQIDLKLDCTMLDNLRVALYDWHGNQSRPLGQSVREGTQTRGDLFLRDNAEVRQLTEYFMSAVESYQSEWSELDPEHPILRYRRFPMGLTAGWSVLIRSSGRHVSHVHDEGLISSAFHVAAPAPDPEYPHQGDLELGRPPEDLALDLKPVAQFSPKVGHLVLFPSFLYHGTRAIHEGQRLAIAFDAAVIKT